MHTKIAHFSLTSSIRQEHTDALIIMLLYVIIQFPDYARART